MAAFPARVRSMDSWNPQMPESVPPEFHAAALDMPGLQGSLELARVLAASDVAASLPFSAAAHAHFSDLAAVATRTSERFASGEGLTPSLLDLAKKAAIGAEVGLSASVLAASQQVSEKAQSEILAALAPAGGVSDKVQEEVLAAIAPARVVSEQALAGLSPSLFDIAREVSGGVHIGLTRSMQEQWEQAFGPIRSIQEQLEKALATGVEDSSLETVQAIEQLRARILKVPLSDQALWDSIRERFKTAMPENPMDVLDTLVQTLEVDQAADTLQEELGEELDAVRQEWAATGAVTWAELPSSQRIAFISCVMIYAEENARRLLSENSGEASWALLFSTFIFLLAVHGIERGAFEARKARPTDG